MTILYRGKDIETMNRDELLKCVKDLYQKLKDKHNIIQGMKMMNQASSKTEESYASIFAETIGKFVKKK